MRRYWLWLLDRPQWIAVAATVYAVIDTVTNYVNDSPLTGMGPTWVVTILLWVAYGIVTIEQTKREKLERSINERLDQYEAHAFGHMISAGGVHLPHKTRSNN